MSGKRKTFKCGHRGFGQWCHRCHQAIDLDAQHDKLIEIFARPQRRKDKRRESTERHALKGIRDEAARLRESTR